MIIDDEESGSDQPDTDDDGTSLEAEDEEVMPR